PASQGSAVSCSRRYDRSPAFAHIASPTAMRPRLAPFVPGLLPPCRFGRPCRRIAGRSSSRLHRRFARTRGQNIVPGKQGLTESDSLQLLHGKLDAEIWNTAMSPASRRNRSGRVPVDCAPSVGGGIGRRQIVHNLAGRGIYSDHMAMTASSSNLRILGNSDMALTPIGFGAWAIGGGDWQYAWGPQDDKDSIAAIHKALDMGINWIDTAAIYGLGHSEEVVAKALRTASRKPYVFTKCSLRWRDDKSIYNSLKQASVAEE